MAEELVEVKPFRVSLPADIVEREKALKEKAKSLSVPYDQALIFETAVAAVITKGLDKFEMNDLAAAGHMLSADLENKKLLKEQSSKGALVTREKNRLDVLDAQKEFQSLHSVLGLADETPETIFSWNIGVKSLAIALKNLNTPYKKRKLRNGVDDIVIEGGWNSDLQLMARLAFKVQERESELDSSLEKDRIFEPEPAY